jgi:hypothetical protein
MQPVHGQVPPYGPPLTASLLYGAPPSYEPPPRRDLPPGPRPPGHSLGTPEVERLVYPGKVAMPSLCACCAVPATTTADTDAVLTGTRQISWFRFPYCQACARHIRWSGRPGTGAITAIGWLFALGGAAAGLALGLSTARDAASGAVWLVLGGAFGFGVAVMLVWLTGLAVAKRTPGCTAHGRPVKLTRAAGGYQFAFSNRHFDRAFRSTNQGSPPIDMRALVRNLARRRQ